MIRNIEPGTYVVATSGGVDSMVLLDILRRQPGVKIIVAHYDHGIRNDSGQDRQLVQDVAARHGLQFVYDQGNLGSNTSEDVARQARYAFLHRVRDASKARAIITAHHQDDLLETAIHNMLRGTGRRGLVSLRSREHIQRPLLHIPKADITAYAKAQGLAWNEDSTNTDLRYRRNYIRHQIMPKFSINQKKELLQHIRNIHRLHEELESQLINHLHLHPGKNQLNRHWFIMLPHGVAREVMATWLRLHGITEITSGIIERLIVASKTFVPGKQADIDKDHILQIKKDILALERRVR